MLAVAFLRAVNLASHNRVAMADLCSMLTELKLSGARALLASGIAALESWDREASSELVGLALGEAVHA